MGEHTRFFTFPVELLRGAFTDIEGVCSKAISYAVFVRCKDYEESPEEAFGYFGINGNSHATVMQGKEVYESLYNPPLTSINKDIIFDFYKNPKSDFDKAVFCAFCGLRSIIGTKSYVKTNNGLLMARMFGYRLAAEFTAVKQKPAYYKSHFSTAQKIRYQLTEKIIKRELSLSWGLKYYSNQSKGFYVSFSMDFESLVTHAEKSRKSTLLKQKEEAQKQIIERVRKQIRGK